MADLINETTKEYLVNGFFQVEHTRQYQVFAADTSVGSSTVANASGVPAIGAVIMYGTTPVYCYDREAIRTDIDHGRLKWMVTCRFSNDTSRFLRDYLGRPVDDPADSAATVDISFAEVQEPFNEGKFLGMETNGVALTHPYWFANINENSRVMNSATDNYQETRRGFEKSITYWKYYDSYDNSWEDLIGKTNSNTVTMTQTDQRGTRLSQSFDPRSLLLTAIHKQDAWKQGNLYFRIGFQFYKSETGFVRRLKDEGVNWFAYTGQKEIFELRGIANGDTVSGSDGWVNTTIAIPTEYDWGNYIDGGPGFATAFASEPVALNGSGLPLSRVNFMTNTLGDLEHGVIIKYLEYEETSFTPLGIS